MLSTILWSPGGWLIFGLWKTWAEYDRRTKWAKAQENGIQVLLDNKHLLQWMK